MFDETGQQQPNVYYSNRIAATSSKKSSLVEPSFSATATFLQRPSLYMQRPPLYNGHLGTAARLFVFGGQSIHSYFNLAIPAISPMIDGH